MIAALAIAVALAALPLVAPPLPAQARPGVRTTPAATPVMARVSGSAYDSVARRPLAGAIVQLVDANDPALIRSARADDRGAFVFDSVRLGLYLLGVLHPRLDTLGLDSPLLRVDVQTGGAVEAFIALPSAPTLRAARCGDGRTPVTDGLFMGSVRKANAEALDRPARVRVQWSEMRVAGSSVRRETLSRYATTTGAGVFALCAPPGVPMTARTFAGPDSSGFVELTMPRDGFLLRDLYIGSGSKVPVTGSTAVTLRGRGRVRGVVRDTAGRAIPGARVALRGGGTEVLANASGLFVLTDVPTGTFTLEARALGFEPAQLAVDVLDHPVDAAEVTMSASVARVDTMRVRANSNRGTSGLAEFERRRRSAFGHFIDETELTARAPRTVADIFRSTPGMTIMPGQSVNDRVLMRGTGGSGSCVPAIFLNGLSITTGDGTLDGVIQAQDVRAVEIYARSASIPVQFEARNGCGSIVIWTGPRSAPAVRR